MPEINSKYYAELWKQELKEEIKELKSTPSLTIIIGKDYYPPSKIYVNNKLKVAKELGIKTNLIEIEWENKTKEELTRELQNELNICYIEGGSVIIQDPFPLISQKTISEMLEDYYMLDVDGFSQTQKYLLSENNRNALVPCTALGVIKLLKYVHGEDLTSKSISIFSRSNLIGKPLLQLALNENMTPTVLHSKSHQHSKCMAFASDIIVTGCGKRKLFNSDDIMNSKASIVDCSMDKIEGIKGVGDCDKEDVLEYFPKVDIASGYNHTGLFTVLALMNNVIKAHKINSKEYNYEIYKNIN